MKGEKPEELPLEYDFKDKPRTMLIAEVGGIVAQRPGRMEAELKIGDKSLSKWTMPIDTVGMNHQQNT
ncbi:hypothetical protein TH24_11665 [Thalassospira xiamenensis]|nr:hypothetical protein TH24_11665 [Thalassospira xiamenensis]